MFPDETSGSEEETGQYYIPASEPSLQSRRKKKPKAQSKTSQSLFSIIVSVNHGLIALQMNAMVNTNCPPCLFSLSHYKMLCRWMGVSFCCCFHFQKDKTVLKNKHGEFWLEVKNGVLFSVMQHEGYKDQHYLCFHTSSICMYHQGNLTQ